DIGEVLCLRHVDTRYGPGNKTLAFGSVSHHDHFVKRTHIFHKLYVEHRLAAQRSLLRCVPDGRKDQGDPRLIGNGDAVIALSISYRPQSSSPHDTLHARHPNSVS